MSLSKSANQCRRCALLASRPVHTESAQGAKTHRHQVEGTFKMSLRSQFRNMPISQWKLISHLKDYVSKTSNENGTIYIISREWNSLVEKLPAVYGHVENVLRRSIVSASTNSSDKPNMPRSTLNAKGANNDGETIDTTSKTKEITDTTPQTKEIAVTEGEGQYSLPQVLSGLKKLRMNPKAKESRPTDEIPSQWKLNKEIVSKTSISSRTKHVVSAVSTAQSTQSKLKRLEDLTNHLYDYPEAKSLAVKEGAVRMLLHLRHETEDEATLTLLRETFALLGHIEPLRGRGIRILSIDGGGIRGVLAIEMLKKLEELTGKRIYELFDYVCGVSTGAILATLIGAKKTNLNEVSVMYKELSTKIFTQNSFWGTSNLVWSHAYYDTELWEKILKDCLGVDPLIKTARDPEIPKVSSISTVVNKARVMAFVFRNYSLPPRLQSQYTGSHQHKLWEAVRASAAAPLYFEEFKLGDLLHQDGGILVNNPTAVAIHEARQLWPTSPLQCVVSLGTGRFNPVHHYPEEVNTSMSSWKTKFMKILDSATDTEAVHTMLNDLIPGSVYHRFNPYITEMVTMDEISPDKILQLEMDATMYYRRNEDKFQDIAKALLQKRSIVQHCQDWLHLQRQLVGIS